ncbi:uncharacterized protein L201_006399 [Kwoniella dendrophila CBS 6074]|uniref:Major facilitator superfamily (MFS) profile domain-containing protein n=1 Tax=Kwoniella dendrophila CBS 6074 TaxID=1295534 RepID=A0AAX4K3X9_9TREE
MSERSITTTNTTTITRPGNIHDGSDIALQGVNEHQSNTTGTGEEKPVVRLSQTRKWCLLLVFSMAQYLDVAAVSGMFIFTDQISENLGILYETSTWIITSYVVTFSAFLLFFGRVSDLYSAKTVFTWSFFFVGIMNLILSFMNDQYAFFVFRALSGLAGAGTIPSAFRLILTIFETEEHHFALTMFGLSGGIANATGLVIAGLFGFITAQNQHAAWRWFFRMIAVICIPFAILAMFLIPKSNKHDHNNKVDAQNGNSERLKDKIQKLDIIGTLIMLFGIILLILGLTLGASYGWTTAKFLAPFLLSWPLLIGFFIWESKLSKDNALIPVDFWKILNMPLMIFITLGIYSWWNLNQLVLIQRFLSVFGEEPIIASLRILPSGIAVVLTGIVLPKLLSMFKVKSFKWMIIVCSIISALAFVLMIYSHGEIHGNNHYWKWYFPALFLGSAAQMGVFLGANITVMTSVPTSMSGVAGALFQVSLQVGAVIGLSIQAGLLTLYSNDNVKNYHNIQASFWFEFGWLILNAILVLVFYQHQKTR